eukprot:CAMPEP_0197633026 /NCGR_PEP_ID=MMETSP1338-20131121/9491_1 /TAXON_ID=43686 ORGANISM="Pelagodinium beii, Strain RCC1491" /NCGR_SAMPLE_ID=MMETSP1338 /ASSEMBLY_ACC=CAM_ASM_000754 /LENGTH=443 /DNA_ID=CAMNT_0043204609 /DNA_START=9 /DNA_END=1337 /DNA_ORIENTATION=-
MTKIQQMTVLLIAESAVRVGAHGMMTIPVSRNFNYWSQTSTGDADALSNCAADGCSCGALNNGQDYAKWEPQFRVDAPSNPHSVLWPPELGADLDGSDTTPVLVNTDGTIDVAWQLTASHYGYIELRLCYDVEAGGTVTSACFDGEDKVIKRTDATSKHDILPLDQNYPQRYYLGPVGLGWGQGVPRISTYPAVYMPPYAAHPSFTDQCPEQYQGACRQAPPNWEGLYETSPGIFERKPADQPGDSYAWKVQLSEQQISKCKGGARCVLQMLYVTANSCQPPGLVDYYSSQAVQDWIQQLPIDDIYKNISKWYTEGTLADCFPGSTDWDNNGDVPGPSPEKFWNCADVQLCLPPNSTIGLIQAPCAQRCAQAWSKATSLAEGSGAETLSKMQKELVQKMLLKAPERAAGTRLVQRHLRSKQLETDDMAYIQLWDMRLAEGVKW